MKESLNPREKSIHTQEWNEKKKGLDLMMHANESKAVLMKESFEDLVSEKGLNDVDTFSIGIEKK